MIEQMSLDTEMVVSAQQVTMLTIMGGERLDPVRVVLEDISSGEGRITIGCYGVSWENYWGGLGKQTIAQFVVSSTPVYLADCFARGRGPERTMKKPERTYLLRIIQAVQAGLRQHLEAAA